MSISRSVRRSALSRALCASLALAGSAGVCLAAELGSTLDLSGWTLFDPDEDWTFTHPTTTSVKMSEVVGSSAVHPGWVLSDVILGSTATVEFDLGVAAGTGDDDLMGFGFSWLDSGHSWLLDWKKTTQSFNWGQPVVFNDDVAEQGLKIKRIDGEYSWDGLWGGQDGQGVSTIAGPTGGGWVAGTVYHFELQLSPGHIVVTRDGVGLFDVLDPSFPGGVGKIACYSFSQTNTVLDNVVTAFPNWTDLGLAKAGSSGFPALIGSGPLSASSLNQLSLSKAAPSSVATLVVGLSAINAPFKGGTLVPQPQLLVALPTDSGGLATLPFIWPAGVPAGVAFYFQIWVKDVGAMLGLSASNGLKGVSS